MYTYSKQRNPSSEGLYMKLGSTRPTGEGSYLTEIMHLGGTSETGEVRNVQYGTDATSNGSYAADGAAGEDALIYFIRAWNEDDTTGYISIYEDVNNNKMCQGNVSSSSAITVGEPKLYFDGSTDVNTSTNAITLPSGDWKDLEHGMKVKYNNNGNTSIGGLTSGDTYYLRKKDANEAYFYTNQETAKTDSGLSSEVNITSTQSGDHRLDMFDADFLSFFAALGPDDISGDKSPIAKWEWVFPHPLLLRNGFAVRTSDGVNISLGYRNLNQSTPIGVARNSGAPLEGQNAERFKKGQGETVLKAMLNYGNDNLQITTGKTEVWGIHGINTSDSNDRTTIIYDSTGSTSASNKRAHFTLSKTVNSGAERGGAMLGPLNFDPPLLCENGLLLHAPSNTQIMVIYRQIE